MNNFFVKEKQTVFRFGSLNYIFYFLKNIYKNATWSSSNKTSENNIRT